MFDWFYTQTGFSAVLMLVVVGAGLTAAGYSTFLERKMAAWMQDRIGPNRAGPGFSLCSRPCWLWGWP
jgi:NADH:ubiquinone oxidoreductase subunit H